MPQAVVGWLVSAGFSLFTAKMIVAFAMSYAVNAIVGAIFKPNNTSSKAEAYGRTQMVKSTIAPRNHVYGTVMISGPLAFAATTDKFGNVESFEGDKKGWKRNQYLHLIIVLASHKLHAIDEVWLGDRKVGDLDANGYVTNGAFYKDRNDILTQAFTQTPGATELVLNATPRRIISVTAPTTVSSGATENDGGSNLFRTWIANEQIPYTLTGNRLQIPDIDSGTRKVTVVWETPDADSLVRIKKHLGETDQEADTDLIAECPDLWTSKCRLRGLAYLYVRLEFNNDVFPYGIPNIKCKVRGKEVLDVRDGVYRWSSNWALCTYDYLRDPEGYGCEERDVDIESVKVAAKLSDESVRVTNGVFQKRYSVNGVLNTDKTPDENMRMLLSCSGGAVNLAAGVLKIHGASYNPPVYTLTESDLRGPIRVQPRTPRRDLFNAVRGTYVNGEGHDPSWLPIDFPQQKNDLYKSQDGEFIVKDVEFPLTISRSASQRLAKMMLERSRQGITIEFPAKMTAFKMECWETVRLVMPKFGWDGKVFRIIEWKFSMHGVDLVLREESPNAYEWNLGRETRIDDSPDTNLPIPGYVPYMPDITITSGGDHLIQMSDGSIMSRMHLTWDQTDDVLVQGSGFAQIEYKKFESPDWIRLPNIPGSSTSMYIGPVADGDVYMVRGRFVSRRGATSGIWTYAIPHIVLGKISPPQDVPWFAIEGDQLTWGRVRDVDLAGYKIRFHYGYNRSWGDASDIHDGLLIDSPYTPIRKPQGTITLMIKAVDTSGNESSNPRYLSDGFGDIEVGNIVESFNMKERGFADTFIDLI